jgi:membrane-associated protein
MLALASLIAATSSLGYALPAIIGLESLGLPSPGETALITAAVLASEGKLQIWLVLLIAISSAIIGDSIGYELGRHLGREVLTARGPLRKERVRCVEAGERFFSKHGSKTVFFARWITGVRSAAAWLAGIDEMHYLTFLAYNAAGAITWGLTYGLVGYFGGQAAADAIKTAGTYALIGLAAVAIALLAFWWWHRRRRGESEGEGPDSGSGSDAGDPAAPGAGDPAGSDAGDPAGSDAGDPAVPGAGDPAVPGAGETGSPGEGPGESALPGQGGQPVRGESGRAER